MVTNERVGQDGRWVPRMQLDEPLCDSTGAFVLLPGVYYQQSQQLSTMRTRNIHNLFRLRDNSCVTDSSCRMIYDLISVFLGTAVGVLALRPLSEPRPVRERQALEPSSHAAMVRTRPPPMLAERVRPIPTLHTGAGRHLVVHRLRWRVDFISGAVRVVTMRQQLCFIGLRSLLHAQLFSHGQLDIPCAGCPWTGFCMSCAACSRQDISRSFCVVAGSCVRWA
jgi:hypothetical protein